MHRRLSLKPAPAARARPAPSLRRMSPPPARHFLCWTAMAPVIKWGIIGCGDVTEKKSGPAFQKASGSQLVAVMRRNADLAKVCPPALPLTVCPRPCGPLRRSC